MSRRDIPAELPELLACQRPLTITWPPFALPF